MTSVLLADTVVPDLGAEDYLLLLGVVVFLQTIIFLGSTTTRTLRKLGLVLGHVSLACVLCGSERVWDVQLLVSPNHGYSFEGPYNKDYSHQFGMKGWGLSASRMVAQLRAVQEACQLAWRPQSSQSDSRRKRVLYPTDPLLPVMILWGCYHSSLQKHYSIPASFTDALSCLIFCITGACCF